MSKNLFIYILSLLILSSCGQNNEQSSIDQKLINVYKLIDSDQPSEAVGYVDLLLEEDLSTEDRYSLEVAQASAYAKLAGFNFKQLSVVSSSLIELAITQKKLDENTKNLKTLKQQKKRISLLKSSKEKKNKYAEVKNKILQRKTSIFGASIDLYSSYIKILTSIPSIDEEGEVFLDQAIYLMDSYGDEILPEDAVFRVLLRTLKARGRLSILLLNQKNDSTCFLGLTSIFDELISGQNGLDKILKDLSIARPSSNKQILKLRHKIRDGSEALTVLKSLTNLLDDLAEENFSVLSYELDEIFKFNCSSF